MANKINERGQISGMAIVRSGPDEPDIHAFVATAVSESMGLSVADAAPIHPKSNLPVNLDKQRLQRFGLVRAIKGILGASAPCIVSHKLHEGARSKVVRDNIGHTKIDVTQNIYARAGGKCEWMRVTATGKNKKFCCARRDRTHPGPFFIAQPDVE